MNRVCAFVSFLTRGLCLSEGLTSSPLYKVIAAEIEEELVYCLENQQGQVAAFRERGVYVTGPFGYYPVDGVFPYPEGYGSEEVHAFFNKVATYFQGLVPVVVTLSSGTRNYMKPTTIIK